MPSEAAQMHTANGDEGGRTRAGKVRLRALTDIDARTAAYRRFKELVGAYTSDLGGDLTTAESAIIQRVVSLQVWLEDAEVSYAESGDLPVTEYTTVTNAMRRLLADIGLQRRMKDVTPDLGQYARRSAAA